MKRAVVIPIPDDLIGNRISAVIEVSGGDGVEKEELLNYCYMRLPKYMVPEVIRKVDGIPKNANGKIDRPAMAGWTTA